MLYCMCDRMGLICLNILHSVVGSEDRHGGVSCVAPRAGFCLMFIVQTED